MGCTRVHLIYYYILYGYDVRRDAHGVYSKCIQSVFIVYSECVCVYVCVCVCVCVCLCVCVFIERLYVQPSMVVPNEPYRCDF
jgi:hypothetical protein